MSARNDVHRKEAYLALPNFALFRKSNIRNGPGRTPPAPKRLLRDVVAYTIALVIVWYIARGVSWVEIGNAARHATLWLFLCVSLAGFLAWFIGETLLYCCLFTLFHGRTRPFELVPTVAAMYFLQIVNSLVASGALVLFLHRRKRVPWMTAGGAALLLLGLRRTSMLLVTLLIFLIVFIPTIQRHGQVLYYGVGVVVAGCSRWQLFPGSGKVPQSG